MNGQGLSATNFMQGYDMCTEAAINGGEKFAYDTITNIIRNGEKSNARYAETVKTFARMASYLNRWYIPREKLPTFHNCAE